MHSNIRITFKLMNNINIPLKNNKNEYQTGGKR